MLLDIFVSFDVFAGCLTKQHAFSMCKSERLLKIMVKGWELKYLNLEFKWEFARSSINSFHMSTSSSFDEGYDKKRLWFTILERSFKNHLVYYINI
jgi:hypothetical protein